MRFSICRSLFLLVIFFSMVLLIPGPALAMSEAKDCPAEPTQNVVITSGTVYAGPNCMISPALDIDSFQFTGASGDTYRMIAAMDGETYPKNICLELYDPNLTKVYSACSVSSANVYAVATDRKMTVSGTYTMVITEQANDATLHYQVSLERINTAPADARPLTLTQTVTDEINPLADMDAFTFTGMTTGTYRTIATIPSGSYPSDLCMVIYRPDGTVAGSGCTVASANVLTIQVDTTPVQTGTHLILLYEAGYDRTVSYNLTVSCLLGTCGSGAPACTLKDTPTYDAASGTLTMKFTIGHQYPVTWNGWLTYQNTLESLWSESRAKTDPPVSVTKTRANLPKVGKAGILSTVTRTQKGITCSSWVLIDTGTP